MFYLTQGKPSCVFYRSKERKKEDIREKIVVGLYLHVSTRNQFRFGHSLDEQEDKLRKLWNFKDYVIYKVYREEGVSAKSMNRPKFQEMIQDMKAGKMNKILVHKLDRLTRSIQTWKPFLL